MLIKKILNNNVVIVEKNNIDKIICGKGVGFQKKAGDQLNPQLVERTFLLENENNKQIEQLFQDIPCEYFEVASLIVESIKQANKQMNFKDLLKITLADHLYGCIKRLNEGYKPLKNMFLWDLKHFYEHEFKIVEQANELIKKYFDTELNDDELGFIVLHILNSQLDNDTKMENMNQIIKEIVQIIRINLNINFSQDSYDYNRLIQHLKYFILRLKNIDNNQNQKEVDESFYDFISNEYEVAFKISLKVFDFLKNQYNHLIDKNEIIYLTIHIQRLINSK